MAGFILSCFMLIVNLPLASAADSLLEDQLRKNYVGSQQMLRHFYDANVLRFDVNGNPTNREKEGPWTLLSGVLVEDLRLKSGKLELRGHRRMQVFDEKTRQIHSIKLDERFVIEIATQDGSLQGAQVSAALARVFVSTEDLSSVVPDYWQDYMARFTGKLSGGAPCEDAKARAGAGDGSAVEPDKLSTGVVEGMKIHDVPPTYSRIARSNRVQGELAMRADIDKAGNISRICIIQALGAGIDDDMVAAVRQWKYRPYSLNGQPTEVQTTIRGKFAMH
jgi:TonB family protein